MAYSQDLRKRVLTHVKRHGNVAQAARLFQVGRSAVFSWLQTGGASSGVKPGPKTGHKLDWAALRQAVQAHPDRLAREHAQNFGVHENTLYYALKRLKLTRKKNTSV